MSSSSITWAKWGCRDSNPVLPIKNRKLHLLSYTPKNGGPGGISTPVLLGFNQAL